jgi:hypothetical protein
VRWLLAARPETDQEVSERGLLGRLYLLAVGRDVASARRAVADLIDEMIPGELDADLRQVGTSTSAYSGS